MLRCSRSSGLRTHVPEVDFTPFQAGMANACSVAVLMLNLVRLFACLREQKLKMWGQGSRTRPPAWEFSSISYGTMSMEMDWLTNQIASLPMSTRSSYK